MKPDRKDKTPPLLSLYIKAEDCSHDRAFERMDRRETTTQQRRYVISARVMGAMHRDSPKVKMFLISIYWSDDSEVIVYRSFQDFKNFHRQLKKRFLLENPFWRGDRMIPKFKARAKRSSVQQKGPSKSVRRMRFLESYCAELLRCDPSVTQSSEVTQFLTPKDHDLQPDFTKNSIMILPSDDLPGGSSCGAANMHSKRLSAGNVTHPLVTQTYRCVAAHETRDTKNRPFNVGADENLDVLIRDSSGWWLVENDDKQLAWFPAPYLESCEEEEGDDDLDEFILGGALFCAVRSYSAKKSDEVSVPIGAAVEVLRKSDDGWWLIRYNGKSGYIPSMYLQPLNNPWAGLHSLQRKLHLSTLNLATAASAHDSSLSQREPQTGNRSPPTLLEENSPQQYPPRRVPNRQPRLQHARSLDVVSEDPRSRVGLQARRCADVPDCDSSKGSDCSMESDVSSISSGSFSESESSSIHGKRLQACPGSAASTLPWRESVSGHSSPDVILSRGSDSSFGSCSSGSVCFKGGKMPPRMPPRPKTQEILTRCTTMTRKAALVTQARFLTQPTLIQAH